MSPQPLKVHDQQLCNELMLKVHLKLSAERKADLTQCQTSQWDEGNTGP